MPAEPQTVLTFRVGRRKLAVMAAEVAEVVRRPHVTRVPQAPLGLAGVTSLRGEVAPVLALDRMLGEKASAGAEGDRLVVLRGSPPLGLAVDEVTGLARGENRPGALVVVDDGETRLLALDTLLAEQFGASAERRRARGAQSEIKTARPEPEVALLHFELAGQSYALPLEQVGEVLALPKEIATLPHTDEAMLGVVRWRGGVLPVASTRALLGLPASAPSADARIVVALIGDARVGLMVDSLTRIARSPVSAIGAAPGVLNRGAGEARIDALLRTANGGLVAMLAPERLFRDESVAQILEDGRQRGDDMTEQQTTEEMRRFLIFRLGEEEFGMPVEAVREVAPLPSSLTRLPKAPAFLAGVMNLRGDALPVVDQRVRFDIGGAGPADGSRVIVARLGDTAIGFAVDAVSEILAVGESRLSATPQIAADAHRMFDRALQLDDQRIILLVNPQQLLDRAETDLIAAIAAEARSPA